MRLPARRLGQLRRCPPGAFRVLLRSLHLGVRRPCAVQLPPGYAPGLDLPVVYLFRGCHREWLAPRQDATRRRPFPARLAQAQKSGATPAAVLVMPCFASADRAFFATAVDWTAPHLAPAGTGMGRGRFESHLIEEVVPQVEKALGLRPRLRVALGFSLGGLTALQAALRHPGLFQVAAAYDGSFFRDPPGRDRTILRDPLFDPAFGRPRNRRRVREHSPVWLVRHLPQEALAGLAFYLQSGPRRGEPGNSNFHRTQALIRALEARGFSNQLPPVDPRGNHDWDTADRFAMRVLRRVLGGQEPPAGRRTRPGRRVAAER